MYVPTNHVCMDYEPFRVSYTAGQPYVGATLSMFPAPDSHGGMGNFIAWDPIKGEIKWSLPEQFSVWSGALATAGDVVFYGTLEGYLKAVDAETGKELYKFKTPSGIIGNVFTYEREGKQYVGVLSGVGGWAGIGLAAGLTNPMNAEAWQNAAGRAAAGRRAGERGAQHRHRRPRRGGRLCGARRLHRARRPADGLRAAELSGPRLQPLIDAAPEPGAAFCVVGLSAARLKSDFQRIAGLAFPQRHRQDGMNRQDRHDFS